MNKRPSPSIDLPPFFYLHVHLSDVLGNCKNETQNFNNQQLLDETEYNLKNYADRRLCNPPRPLTPFLVWIILPIILSLIQYIIVLLFNPNYEILYNMHTSIDVTGSVFIPWQVQDKRNVQSTPSLADISSSNSCCLPLSCIFAVLVMCLFDRSYFFFAKCEIFCHLLQLCQSN